MDEKNVFIERLKEKLSIYELVDISFSSVATKEQRLSAKQKIKEELRSEYRWSDIKNRFIDDIIINSFLDEDKIIEKLDDFLIRFSSSDMIKIVAGAIALPEKERITKSLWEITKKKIKNNLDEKKMLNMDDFKNLTLLYIVLGGTTLPRETNVVNDIDKMISNNFASE